MGNKLEFNTDDLLQQAAAIQQIRGNLEAASNNLQSQLQNLESDWNSAAGDKFRQLLGSDWYIQVQKYCHMLDDLSNALRYAAATYEPVKEEFNRICLN